MAIAISELPRYLVLEPGGGIRLDMHLEAAACEFDLALESPRPGRSFIVMIGHRSGAIVQRVRLAGKAKILFDPEGPGDYTLVLTNPMADPAVVRLRATAVVPPAPPRVTRRKAPSANPARRRRSADARPDRRSSRSK
ncbi:MAG: hypothetical protein L3K01_08805 [Thermoplasmata archaeon]|nr:hypothetical protein [Thermoplasmata archaeon]MCI4333797.1 hypothetical protein [Thermoplasmata archaeon]